MDKYLNIYWTCRKTHKKSEVINLRERKLRGFWRWFWEILTFPITDQAGRQGWLDLSPALVLECLHYVPASDNWEFNLWPKLRNRPIFDQCPVRWLDSAGSHRCWLFDSWSHWLTINYQHHSAYIYCLYCTTNINKYKYKYKQIQRNTNNNTNARVTG